MLGCSGGIGGSARTTSLLVDCDILIDCGTGVGDLALDELVKIDHVFLTHSHFDHIAMLPMLIDTVGDLRQHPITVYALEDTLRILREHIFNWLVWPDFTSIPDRHNPALRMQAVIVGQKISVAQRHLSVIPAQHTVPAVGYCLDAGYEQLVFSGDTSICAQQIAALNSLQNLRYLLIETALPNKRQDVAHTAQHLSPSLLSSVLAELINEPEVFVTHFKPGYANQIEDEISNLSGRIHPKILRNGQRFYL